MYEQHNFPHLSLEKVVLTLQILFNDIINFSLSAKQQHGHLTNNKSMCYSNIYQIVTTFCLYANHSFDERTKKCPRLMPNKNIPDTS